MTKGYRQSSLKPSVQNLEARCLLSGVTATWVGQNNQDYAGPYSGLKPDGVQDIDVRLDDLPVGRTLTSADIQGLGGGDWLYNGPYGPWSAAYVASPGSTSGDLFFDPSQVETGRPFNVILTFDDGSTANLWLAGGAADPNLRMPSASVQAAWIGQDGTDHAGPGMGVGPDGIQDVHIALSQLSSSTTIQSVRVTSTSGDAWEFGLNPEGLTSADLVRSTSDPSKADLYLNPSQNLDGQTLTIAVNYVTGKTDTTTLIGHTVDPTLPVAPAPSPPTLVSGVSATWIGQDGQTGWANFSVSGLPSAVSVEGATLSGPDHNSWAYQAPANPTYYTDLYAGSLDYHPSTDGQATLAFPPDRNEAGTTLTLRLTFSDGRIAVVPVSAGPTDVGLLSAQPAKTEVTARPGDDLNALAHQYGQINLSPGEYDLTAPLVLDNPVSITAPQGGATLLFTQSASDAPWTAAVKIHSGNTTLDNFSIRFTGPVRWSQAPDYGPSVIGTTDNLDPPGHNDPKTNLRLTRLNIQAPPAGSVGEEAPDLMRLTTARGGLIQDNTFRGGTIEFLYGPWTIQDNTYLGTMPDTWAWDLFAGHSTHDLIIRDNTVSPAPDAGKTWRFLVLTGSDDGAQIVGNHVSGIGPKDTDATSRNAAEIVLTEAYSLAFEGKPLALSPGGLILQIPTPQGDAPGSGAVVAILDGPNAGAWVRIAQALSPTMLLLDSPLPSGSYNISIASGFVNQTYENNTIDARGSSVAADLDLVGNHYGTKVLNNNLLGGGDGLLIQSYPTEKPSIWGWSHTPFFGGVISGNTITDSLRALTLQVNHGPTIKTDKLRTYLAASVTDNTVVWTDSFARTRADSPASGITIGQTLAIDPDEIRVSLSNNQADAPPTTGGGPTLDAIAANLNGQSVSDTVTSLPQVLPGAPSSLSLANDSGASHTDKITSDPRLAIGSATRAASYAYRIGPSGPYLVAPDPSSLLPDPLPQGQNTIFVHALDTFGRAGPDASITFTYDSLPPGASPPSLEAGSDTGLSSTDQITRNLQPAFTFALDPGDLAHLLRDGNVVATGSSGHAVDPGPVPDGPHVYSLLREDPAGNVSTSSPLTVTIDTTSPGPLQNVTTSSTSISFTPPEPGDTFSYRVGTGPWTSVGTATSFTSEGLSPTWNQVQIEAIDAAGNIGPPSSVVINNTPIRVSGQWIGQDGHDLVGPYPVAAPDGIQDVHLVLSGLPIDRTIAFIDVQGLGGSQWQYGGGWGPWKVALARPAGSTSADLYIQPDRVEIGRPFQVSIRFTDGFSTTLWIQGGQADPSLKTPTAGSTRATPATTSSSSSTVLSGPVSTTSSQPAASTRRGRLALLLARREARNHPHIAQNPRIASVSSAIQMILARRQQRLLAWRTRHVL